jgi:hypothetical protein
MTTSAKLSDSIKTLLWGILWIAVALSFMHHIAENPLDELTLIRQAHVAIGSLDETFEHEQKDERGRGYLSDVGVYTFRTPDGRQFNASTRVPTGQLSKQQAVEYLPDDPAVNRIRGDGCASIFEWLWRKVGLGLILLALLLSPGITLQ